MAVRLARPMRFLYLDVDTLRPDHLGCYGYQRPTSPNIDHLAAEGTRFEQLYVSDSPCLPSRTALLTGRFGIGTGVVNHGGRRSEMFGAGPDRRRQSDLALTSWPRLFREAGMWCTTISTFGERHSAYHWYAGFNEVLNLGTDGLETAEQVAPVAIDWLRRKGQSSDWFLHVHFWDPHTPYRTPLGYGEPFADTPYDSWIDEEIVARHRGLSGPHSAQEVRGFGPIDFDRDFPRQPQEIRSQTDIRRMIDGYDTGIHYADHHIGQILSTLADLGIYDDTAIMVSSDHGETLGELGIYCDHQTADLYTHRVPAILRWPGVTGARVDRALRYQFDLTATVADLVGSAIPESWDGASFASDILDPGSSGEERDHLILSCATWATQRSVRFGPWLYVRTYHDAFHDFPDVMLFDLEADPHEQFDLAGERVDVVAEASRLLLDWEATNMAKSTSGIDPLWTVMQEGGGYYVRGRLGDYLSRLASTGRASQAERLAARHQL